MTRPLLDDVVARLDVAGALADPCRDLVLAALLAEPALPRFRGHLDRHGDNQRWSERRNKASPDAWRNRTRTERKPQVILRCCGRPRCPVTRYPRKD